jgi:RimJ/RimL family protein N-acetyltransferase
MRAAVLELAFRGLGALEAHSAAYEWNVQSIRVSEKVGYARNGEELTLRGDKRDRTLCFRLAREAWETRRRDDIEIAGLERALGLFGLGVDLEPLG